MRQHHADRHLGGFPGWGQFVAMLFLSTRPSPLAAPDLWRAGRDRGQAQAPRLVGSAPRFPTPTGSGPGSCSKPSSSNCSASAADKHSQSEPSRRWIRRAWQRNGQAAARVARACLWAARATDSRPAWGREARQSSTGRMPALLTARSPGSSRSYTPASVQSRG